MSTQYKYIQTTTICTKLRNFIYKYLHLKLYLNPVLLCMHIKDSDMCSFCNIHVETVEHLFDHCKYSKELWASLSHYIYKI